MTAIPKKKCLIVAKSEISSLLSQWAVIKNLRHRHSQTSWRWQRQWLLWGKRYCNDSLVPERVAACKIWLIGEQSYWQCYCRETGLFVHITLPTVFKHLHHLLTHPECNSSPVKPGRFSFFTSDECLCTSPVMFCSSPPFSFFPPRPLHFVFLFRPAGQSQPDATRLQIAHIFQTW